MPENENVGELHGCIVCAPDGRLVGCTVTGPGGHIVPDERRSLVTCDTHTTEEIALAYKRWQSTNS
jgi:hypothetical protein